MASSGSSSSNTNGPLLVDYGLLLLLAGLFSSAFVWIALALPSFPPTTIVMLRQAIGALVFLVAMLWAGQTLPAFGKVWLPICGVGLLGNALPFFLVAWGQEQVDAGLASILTSTVPIMALLIGQVFTREQTLTPLKIFAAVLGLSGVITIIGWQSLLQLGDQQIRQLAFVVAATCYAGTAFMIRHLSDQPRLPTVAASMLVSVFMVLPFSIINDRPWTLHVETGPVIAILLLALMATVFGNMLRFEIAGRRGALFLTQISYLMPLLGLFWAWLILGEIPSTRVYMATALILAGIFVFRLGEKPIERKVLGIRNDGVD